MSDELKSNPDCFAIDSSKGHSLNSRILETWINNTVSDAESLSFPDEVIKKESKLPLVRFGVDRTTLLKSGLQSVDVDRLYRSLFVYSIGFYQLIQTILEHTNKKYTIITGIWKIYAILLEYCCQLDYQMIVTTLNLEKREELEQLEAEFQSQIKKLEGHEKEMNENIENSKLIIQEIQKDLVSEIAKREELEDELLRRGSGHEEEVAMRLQFESKLNQMYAKMRDLQTKIELMAENLEDMQKEVNIRTENLQKERNKNVQLMKIKAEVELEMRKTEERFRQCDNLNISLEKKMTDCYQQIESSNINLSNLNVTYNETLNILAQKKIENDELRFSIEMAKGKITKIEAVILEYEAEKSIHLDRISELERTLLEEVTNNKFFKQEYVKIKESDSVNTSELEKYKKKSNLQEKIIDKLEKQKDTLGIKLDSITTTAEEYKTSLKDLQIKLEEMNKGRRVVEEANESLKARLEEKTKEVKECRLQITGLKEEQERMKTKESELEIEITETRIKLQSVQRQFDTTKETLQEKIHNLHDILESEKKIRENWIYRYEDEQKTHSNAIKELIATHDKLNSATIKIANLESFLEESNTQKKSVTESHKTDLEELLSLRAQYEDCMRKNKTLQLLIDNIDNEYHLREEENKKENELIKEILNQQINIYRMRIEEVWVQAKANLDKMREIEASNKSIRKTLQGVDNIINDLKDKLSKKTQDLEGKKMLLEDGRNFILAQNDLINTYKKEIQSLDAECKKGKKELLDFKNLAPQELRNTPNPFRILTKQISDLKGKIDFFENIKNDVKDEEVQWNAPLPETDDQNIQTDDVEFENKVKIKVSRNNSYSKESSRASAVSVSVSGEIPLRSSKKAASRKTSSNVDNIEEIKHLEDSLHHDDERLTPLNLKSIYNKEHYSEYADISQKSPAKLPHITNAKRSLQPSPAIYTPTPIPTLPANDFKRALKQAISRRQKE